MSVSDDFNRADAGSLGPNWTTASGAGHKIASNKAASNESSGGLTSSYYSAVTWNADHTSQMTCGNALNYAAPAARISADGQSAYLCLLPLGWLFKLVGGALTLLENGAIQSAAAGDSYKTSPVGSQITYEKIGGSSSTVVDSSYPTGNAGIFSRNDNSPTIDDWIGTGEIVPVTGPTPLGWIGQWPTLVRMARR